MLVDYYRLIYSQNCAGNMDFEKVDRPELAKHDSSVLDLAFAMDCTGSMSSYIRTAQENIRNIVEQIVASEKSDVHLALVEYRDHPPQDTTFVTRTHDFTPSVSNMKLWLDGCSAAGGGDTPEAVAAALHDVLKLSWREESTKICVLISDAPPHGLSQHGDHFPNGCPDGNDPMQIVRQMAEKDITLYCVGCEPAINPYKDFFMAMAYLTGGQYVLLIGAKMLTQVIIGGAQEELSLQQWMADIDDEVKKELEEGREINEEIMTKKLHEKLKAKGAKSKQLVRNSEALAAASPAVKALSSHTNMMDMKKNYVSSSPAPSSARRSRGMPMGFGAMAAPAMAAPAEDMYDCMEAETSAVQVERMVQRSKMKNMKFFKK